MTLSNKEQNESKKGNKVLQGVVLVSVVAAGEACIGRCPPPPPPPTTSTTIDLTSPPAGSPTANASSVPPTGEPSTSTTIDLTSPPAGSPTANASSVPPTGEPSTSTAIDLTSPPAGSPSANASSVPPTAEPSTSTLGDLTSPTAGSPSANASSVPPTGEPSVAPPTLEPSILPSGSPSQGNPTPSVNATTRAIQNFSSSTNGSFAFFTPTPALTTNASLGITVRPTEQIPTTNGPSGGGTILGLGLLPFIGIMVGISIFAVLLLSVYAFKHIRTSIVRAENPAEDHEENNENMRANPLPDGNNNPVAAPVHYEIPMERPVGSRPRAWAANIYTTGDQALYWSRKTYAVADGSSDYDVVSAALGDEQELQDFSDWPEYQDTQNISQSALVDGQVETMFSHSRPLDKNNLQNDSIDFSLS